MTTAILNQSNVTDFEVIKASLFFVALMITLFMAVVVVLSNSPPIIVGTEMNTNGLVEYLCLGNGCENLQAMDW